MSITTDLTPKVETILNEAAARDSQAPEEIAATWVAAKATEESAASEELSRFREGMARLRETMRGVGPFPAHAYDRSFAYEE